MTLAWFTSDRIVPTMAAMVSVRRSVRRRKHRRSASPAVVHDTGRGGAATKRMVRVDRPCDTIDGMSDGMKPRSHEVTDGFERAPARAMLRAVGMTDDDWDKAQIGVASSWNEVTPCNMSLDRLAKRGKDGIREAGGFPIEFVTIAVSDGISMGHEGMRASLVSREIIADSVEVMMHAERLDGMVTFAGCDKSLPGMLMAAARLNLPSVFLYGGTILPGRLKDQALDIVSVFEAVGAHAAGGLTDEELALIERNACPTVGSCA